MGISKNFSKFYGGTSLIIIVSVVLETLKQIESYILMNYYDKIIKSKNISIKNDYYFKKIKLKK
jgi:preprotein translocase subunit SecY